MREDSSATYFSYDSIYQLTAETQLDFGRQPHLRGRIPVHGAHNRTVKVIDGAPTYHTYNEANQLETRRPRPARPITATTAAATPPPKQAASGTTYLQYNTENLLTRIDFPAGGGHSYYTYDGDFKRVSQRTADGYTGFVYQGPDMLALQLERNEAGTTQAHYTIGQGLESVRRSGVSHFYHYNHLGTTIALTARTRRSATPTSMTRGGCSWPAPARPSTRTPTWAASATIACPTPTSTTSASATTPRRWAGS